MNAITGNIQSSVHGTIWFGNNKENAMTQTVLILGGQGRFARNSAAAFAAAGWQVRHASRSDDLTQVAMGADVIVMGWNPPYHRWVAQVPGQQARVIAAARASGATVVIPGNVYVFGAESGPLLGTDTPHRATNTLGRVRVAMEKAWRDSGLPVILLRMGDFLDTVPSGGMFDRMMITTLPKGTLRYPGRTDITHAWAYLPDAARAVVALAGIRAALPRFADVPFPGFTLTGAELAQGLAQAQGHNVVLRGVPWWQLRLVQPFMPAIAGVFEMRYLWNMPHHLADQPFRNLLPDFAATPLPDALRAATAHLYGARSTQTSA